MSRLTKADLVKHEGRRVAFTRNGIRYEGRLITVDADSMAIGQRGYALVELDDLSQPLVRWQELTPLEPVEGR